MVEEKVTRSLALGRPKLGCLVFMRPTSFTSMKWMDIDHMCYDGYLWNTADRVDDPMAPISILVPLRARLSSLLQSQPLLLLLLSRGHEAVKRLFQDIFLEVEMASAASSFVFWRWTQNLVSRREHELYISFPDPQEEVVVYYLDRQLPYRHCTSLIFGQVLSQDLNRRPFCLLGRPLSMWKMWKMLSLSRYAVFP